MIKEADFADIEAIVQLVNSAYRPKNHERGWTHEADLVSGDRVNAQQVGELIKPGHCLLVNKEAGTIRGCIHIEKHGETSYIGMLATLPSQQNQGLGNKLLVAAEHIAKNRFGAIYYKMSVLSSRPELLAYYERRGYQLTGKTAPYPLTANVGQPYQANLQVLELIKPVQP